MRRRDPLAADRHAAVIAEARRRIAALSPQEMGALMRQIIHQAIDRTGTAGAEDLRRELIPENVIATRGRAIVLEVEQERRDGGITT